MTRQEVQATLKAMQIIMHLHEHLDDMAKRETDKTQEHLICAGDALSLAVQAMNSAIVIELMDGGDQA